MPACSRCGAVFVASETADGRCGTCGSFLPRTELARQTVAESAHKPSGTVAESAIPPAAPERREPTPADLIRPRNLSPEFMRHFTAHWEATEAQFKHPRETLNSSSSATADAADLVIGSRSLVNVADENRGDYELKDVIGEGNMGTVWSARQSALDRDVALKIPKPTASQSELGQNLFISEVVVTGQLDHPNIVPIYDLARDEKGQLFYSMKRVEGRPWNECMHDGSRDQRDNVEILMKVCDAIRFAHDRGVIHRDIKPHNVMVGRYGEVSVMDWGIAVRLDADAPGGGVTKLSPAGTPAYMAPEMATVSTGEIGLATDVYLLGAVLFEIITGEPPHPPPTDSQDQRKLRTDALVIAARNVIVPVGYTGELVDIAFRALATDISNRYQTVAELQAAIREYFSHAESIKLAERGQEHLAAARALQNGVYEDFAKSRFAFAEAVELWPENAKARAGLAEATIAYAQTALERRDYALGISLLDKGNQEHSKLLGKLAAEKWKQDRNRLVARASMVAAATCLLLVVVASTVFAVRENKLKAEAVRLKNVAESEKEQKEQERAKAESERLRAEGEKNQKELERAKAESERLRAEGEKNQKELERARAESERIRAESVSYQSEIGLAADELQRNAFDRAQEILNEQTDNPAKKSLRNWEWGYLKYLATEQPTVSFDVGGNKRVESVAISPDKKWLVAGTTDGDVLVWECNKDGEPVRRPVRLHYGRAVNSVAISGTTDGTLIAAAGVDREKSHPVKIWKLPVKDATEPAQTIASHMAPILSIVFSKDAQLLLTSAADGTAELWRRNTNEVVRTFHADLLEQEVWSAQFSPDESWIITGSEDGTVRVWKADAETDSEVDAASGLEAAAQPSSEVRRYVGDKSPVLAAVFSPDGRHVIAGTRDGRLFASDFRREDPSESRAARGSEIKMQLAGMGEFDPESDLTLFGQHTAAISGISFSSDARRVFTASHDNTIRVWKAIDGVPNKDPEKTLRGHGGWVRDCVATADNRVLSAGYDGRVLLWDWKKYQFPRVLRFEAEHSLANMPLTSSAVSPDGRWVATGSEVGVVVAWNLDNPEDPQPQLLTEGHEWQATTGIFFDQGRRLLTSGGDNTTLVWDAVGGNQLMRFGDWHDRGTGWRGVAAVAANGRLIATGSGQREDADEPNDMAKIWDVQTRQPVASLAAPQASESPIDAEQPEATVLAFAPDDASLFIGDQFGQCYLFDTRSGALRTSFSGHAGKVSAAKFLPAGRYLLTAGADRHVVKWDLQAGQPQIVARYRHDDPIVAMDVSFDGTQAITATGFEGKRAALQRWDTSTGRQLSTLAISDTIDPTAIVRSVAIHPSEPRALVTLYFTGRQRRAYEVGVWDWAQVLNPYHRVSENLHDVSMAVYSPAQKDAVLTVGGRGARLRFANRTLMKFQPQSKVCSVSFSPDGRLLASAGEDGSVKIWQIDDQGRSWRPAQTLLVEGQSPVKSVVFDPKRSDVLLAALADGTAELWQTVGVGWKRAQIYGQHRADLVAKSQAIFSPKGDRILTVFSDRTAVVWDRQSGQPLPNRISLPSDGICAAYSPKGDWIVFGMLGSDNNAIVYNVHSANQTELKGHSADVTSVAFTPDGKRLFTASRDSAVKVWKTDTFERDNTQDAVREMLTLEVHRGGVTSVTFSSQGTQPFLITTGLDGQAILWPSERIEH